MSLSTITRRGPEISDAIGRPVTKVILDRDDNVVLNMGDIVTHQAIQRAHEAGGPSRNVTLKDFAIIGDAELARVRDALSGGSANDLKMAERVVAALAAPSSAARASALEGFFCTDGKARNGMPAVAVRSE